MTLRQYHALSNLIFVIAGAAAGALLLVALRQLFHFAAGG